MQTGSWNLKHWEFKILSQIRHWNHTKIVCQLVVINFSKSLPRHRIFRAKIAHWLFFIYHFFCILNFNSLFFPHFYNTSNNLNPERQNFSPTKSIFISNFSQHKYWKTKETYYEIKKQNWNFKDIMELMCRNLYGCNKQA